VNRSRNRVRVAVVGAGFAASFHLASYARVYGLDLEVVGIASRTRAKAEALAQRHGLTRVYPDLEAVLADDEINMVDLCVPVHLHKDMAIAAATRGKHVVCEKPLTGYLGPGNTSKLAMYRQVCDDLRAIRQTFAEHGVYLLYAENWIYAPAVRRGIEIMQASGGTILDIRGHESHSGSASEFSKRWETSGGGALMRLGIHPLSAAIYLKQWEGMRRQGRPIHVRAVYGQMADLTSVASVQSEEKHWLVTGWQDVENWSLGALTFDDGTVAVISASDIALGGLESGMEVYLSNARVRCNMDPNDTCQAYAPGDSVLGGVFLNEKLETNAGWSCPAVDHDWASGYQQEVQDFCEAVAEGRPPVSGIDLAEEAIAVAYALYVSAEQGRRLTLDELQSCQGSWR